jgi:hypothetical protein
MLRRSMALTIRIPKTHVELNRRVARDKARAVAEGEGHKGAELQNATLRMERVDGAVAWDYVVVFPNASG